MSFDLPKWLDYLENRHVIEVQLRLINMQNMVKRMAISASLLNCPVITVTGTNGKGSTVRMLEAIYMRAGYRVGSYTSPHLLTFNERITINQNNISDQDLCRLFNEINQQPGGELLTYFEMTTIAALVYFKEHCLDVILLEVGVGGRLDATNAIDADLAIMTTVAIDHQNYLGSTEEEIGTEKAGILRPGGYFVFGDEYPPQSVIAQAKNHGVKSYYFGKEYFFDEKFHLTLDNKIYALPYPNLHPKAAAAAIVATFALQERLPICEEDWSHALKTANIHGRQQMIIKNGVTYIFDVAHNPQAAQLLSKVLSLYPGRRHAIFSGLVDKDLANIIAPVAQQIDIWYPVILTGKRAANLDVLEQAFIKQNPTVVPEKFFDSPEAAYRAVQATVNSGEVVVVYGSFLVVSPILKHMMGA